MSDRRSKGTKLNLIRVFLLALSLVSLLVSFYPEWHVWGLDSLRVFPPAVRVALVVLLAATLVPSTFTRLIPAGLTSGTDSGQASNLTLALVAGVYLFLGLVLASENHLLGDGLTLLRNVEKGLVFSATEPLDYLAHQAAYAILPSGEIGSLWSYRLCSYLAGLLFLLALFVSFRKRQLFWVAVTAGSCFAVIQFFFGYVESYTFAFVFAFLYLLAARNDLGRRRLSWCTLLLLLASIGFHLSSIVLTPTLVYLVWNRWRTALAALASGSVMLLILVAGIVFASLRVEVGQIMVPLAPTAQNPYHLFSLSHITDLANIMLLDYPLLPIILLLLIGKRRLEHRWFHLAALLPPLAFVVLIDPKIGALRDWDLLAIASAPAILALLAILTSWHQSQPRLVQSLVLPLALFGIVHTGSFIASNHSRESAYTYIKSVIRDDPHYSEDYYAAYRCKSWGTVVAEEFEDYREAARAETLRLQAAPDDHLNRYNLAMHYFFHFDQLETAAELLSGHWQSLIDDSQRVLNIAGVFRLAGLKSEEGQVLASFVKRGMSNKLVFFNYARWLAHEEDYERADDFFRRAYEIWPDAPADARLEHCLLALEQGRKQQSLDCLKRIAPDLEPRLGSIVQALIPALTTNDGTVADSLTSELRRLLPH